MKYEKLDDKGYFSYTTDPSIPLFRGTFDELFNDEYDRVICSFTICTTTLYNKNFDTANYYHSLLLFEKYSEPTNSYVVVHYDFRTDEIACKDYCDSRNVAEILYKINRDILMNLIRSISESIEEVSFKENRSNIIDDE